MYQSMQCISNYCATHKDSCEDCVITNLCDCMSKAPCNWDLSQVKELQKIQDESKQELLELKAKLHNENVVADDYKYKCETLSAECEGLVRELNKLSEAFSTACIFISRHKKVHDGVSSQQVKDMFLKSCNIAEDFVIDD